VKVEIVKKNGGSYINLHFGFLKTYLLSLVAAVVGAVVLFEVLTTVSNARVSRVFDSLARADYLAKTGIVAWALAFMVFLITLAVAGYETSATRRRFIEEFNMFIRSLSSKSD